MIIEPKFKVGAEVLLDYGGGYGIFSTVTDWIYSPNSGLSYELKERPGRYWDQDRITILDRG